MIGRLLCRNFAHHWPQRRIVVDFDYLGEVDAIYEQLRLVIKEAQVGPLEEKKKI
jgi:hypothetical protein